MANLPERPIATKRLDDLTKSNPQNKTNPVHNFERGTTYQPVRTQPGIQVRFEMNSPISPATQSGIVKFR